MSMKNYLHKKFGFFCYILAAMLFFVPQVSRAAAFDLITASPLQAQVALGRMNTVNIVWTIQATSATAVSITYSSVSGEFRTKTNVVLGSVNTILPSRTIVVPANNIPVTFTMSETLNVPSYIIDSARKLGFNQITFARQFSGTGFNVKASAEGQMTLNIASSSSGSLAVTQMAISFDSGETQRVIGSNGRLQANVRLDTRGTGLFRAMWEVTEPPSTLGDPVWRPLQQVQRSLAGSENLVLTSPPLPTRDFGLYFVRLRVLQPDLIFSEPSILYVVEKLEGSSTIHLLAPQGLTVVNPKTRFQWQPVIGAEAYRLQVFTQELRVKLADNKEQGDTSSELVPGRRVAGVLVKPGQVAASLSDVSLSHLQAGKHYFWQVQAIDKNGRVMATSQLSEIIGQ
jgi:hypothetical protein